MNLIVNYSRYDELRQVYKNLDYSNQQQYFATFKILNTRFFSCNFLLINIVINVVFKYYQNYDSFWVFKKILKNLTPLENNFIKSIKNITKPKI